MSDLRYELKPWQEETFKYNLKNHYAINALGCGLGKSLTALHTAFSTNSKPLVVCPTYLKDNWVAEVQKFFPGKIISVMDTGKKIYKVWDCDIVITSYGLIDKCEPLFEWADFLIADEAHALKNCKAIRTENFHRLLFENNLKRALFLTGTPMQNRVFELYSLMAMCYYNPRIDEPPFLVKYPTYVDFADHFSFRKETIVKRKGRPVRMVTWDGLKNADELREWLRGIFIRFDTSVLGLEATLEKEVLMSRSENVALWESFQAFNEDNRSVMPTEKASTAAAKVPFTVDYVRDLLEHEDKVIIYTDHTEAGKKLAAAFNVPLISGEMVPAERTRVADHFRKNKTSRVLVATLGSFSTGVNLIECTQMVFNDFPWVPGTIEQAKYRINRLGQTKVCTYHYVLGSIQDGYILNTIMNKTKTIKEALE